MSLSELQLSLIECMPRKACNNSTPIGLICSECVLDRKNSKKFDSPKSLYHHIITVHKDWNNRKYTKKQFIKMLDGLAQSLDLGLVLGGKSR